VQDGDARVQSLTVKRSGRPAPAEPAGGRAFGARERGLQTRGVDGSSHRQLGKTLQVARRVRNRRPTLRFNILKHSPRPADRAPITTQLAAIIDRLASLMKPAEQKGRRRYSKGGVGERLWSWEEEASDPETREQVRAP
jgi:hypothetical protein